MIQRRRGQGLGLALLALQVMNIGVENIPPVTLATVAAQVAIFLQIGDLSRWFPSANTVCISAYRVMDRKEWQTLILGALFHADDIHLYYNMASMLWKGRQLERRFKSVYFAYLLTVFTVMTSIVYVGLNVALSHLLQDRWYNMTCAVGFSGVLFALKVLTSHYSDPGVHRILGFIPVSSKVVYWAELVVIQMITPNASFTGHLAGILVGLLYIKGPLKIVMDSVLAPADRGQNSNFNYRSEPSAPPPGDDYNRHTGGETDYNRYTGGLSEEEQIRRATDESLRDGKIVSL
ncbi:hypothetical protein FSP39_020554 [Pinctada imbricata]|uniref:Peptidase S54 rhomboid domain-containing protein n=1 Tax=Pinctada imbricata TaxID=66713 RepID=A0AA88Y100_PINIB|nr:hypothetical protein FSP39_020554 [Pinctada imbricata]